MNEHFQQIILKSTGASELKELETIQSLWSGYGKIQRYELKGTALKTVVVKHVMLPEQHKHPRGWNTDISHERKLKSYKVETAWYKDWSKHCGDWCKVPKIYALKKLDDEVLMVMEDLDESGFGLRRSSVNWRDVELCLQWLANFHATFIHKAPEGLWEVGTYWHLATRPDELKELNDKELKSTAALMDKTLSSCKYLSFVHGDAKLANFCFSDKGDKVAAVDFQYVGGGCGMKDVAYFVGSCMYEEDCEQNEQKVLDYYFAELQKALSQYKPDLNASEIEEEWRTMYHVAWADFHRFLKGWSPGHWKINSYSERVCREVIDKLR